jgi:hypothetical protein
MPLVSSFQSSFYNSCKSNFQPFYRLAVNQVGIDDFIHVSLVDVGVPDAIRVHHADRAFFASIQATRLVDAYFSCPRKTQPFDSSLGVFPDLGRSATIAARTV